MIDSSRATLTPKPASTVPVFNAAAVLEERLIEMVDIERIRHAHFREGSSVIRELEGMIAGTGPTFGVSSLLIVDRL